MPADTRSLTLYIVLVLCFGAVAAAEDDQDRLILSLDPDLSFETGADLSFSLVSLTARAEDYVFSPLEDRPVARRPARAAWALLFDMPVAWWFGVFLHEAYGHGGRAREFGSSAGFHMGSPWEGRSSYATFESEGMTNDELLRVYTGGSEANGWAATLLEREVVAGRTMRPLELLFLTSNRFVVSDYVLRTTPDPQAEPKRFWVEWSGGGDVANYLGYHSARFVGEPGITPSGSSPLVVEQYERMKRHAYWNALDPGAWLALITAWRTVFSGEESSVVPLPQLRGRRFLPVFSADWLPDGGTASLELIFGGSETTRSKSAPRWFSFVVRRGRGPGGAFGAVGTATESFLQTRRLRVGGEVEIWDQPGHGPGGGFRLRISSIHGRLQRLFVDLGAKSAGHWPGRPAEPGPILRVGLRLPI